MKNEILLYQSDEIAEHIEGRINDEKETIWLTQKQMGIFFDKDTDTIGLHLKNIYFEQELGEDSTTGLFPVVQKEGSRNAKRKTEYYNLDVITGRLNVQVKRNPECFPDFFMYQLTQTGWDHLRSQNATLKDGCSKLSKCLPYVIYGTRTIMNEIKELI